MSVSVSPPFASSSANLRLTVPKGPSPPRTPVDHLKPRSSSSTSSDDSSIIDDLSFEYVFDDEGNYVRLSKGGSAKSNHSTPPTPADRLPRDSDPPPSQPNLLLQVKPPSPISLNSPIRRGSLSRSESAYPVLNGPGVLPSDRVNSAAATARSFQRVASGPALIKSATSFAGQSQPKGRLVPRRVTMEDQEPQSRKSFEDLHIHNDEEPRLKQEEKENRLDPSEYPYVLAIAAASARRNSPPLATRSTSLSGMQSRGAGLSRLLPATRPLADVPVPQRASDFQILPGPNRPGRILKGLGSAAAKFSAASGFGRISETEASVNDSGDRQQVAYPNDDTDIIVDDRANGLGPPPVSAPPGLSNNPLSHRQRSHGAIGGTSAPAIEKATNNRPRRSASLSESSALEDNPYNFHQINYQQEQLSHVRPGSSMGLIHQSTSRAQGPDNREPEPSDQQKYLREEKTNGRRTPDILHEHEERQYASQVDGAIQQSHLRPTYTHRRRDSDTVRSAYTCSSPTVVEAAKPTALDQPQKRLSPVSRSSSAAGMHRRSPTAPEPPTTSSTMAPPNGTVGQFGTTWASAEKRNAANGQVDVAKGLKKQSSIPTQQQHSRPAPPAPQPTLMTMNGQGSRQFTVNKKTYARLDLIGKGGTSRVFRVMNASNELFALKRVSLDKTDADALHGYMNEIALLKRLDGNSRIIRLYDSELKAGPNGSKGYLLMVMECGEIDLARLLHEQQKEPMNMVWIAYYWQQMLQAVHVIHEEKIVHSDLKPANFVLVKGQLKLIDFGIANAIANDTTNVQRDATVGTVNYMSPEAIELPDGMRRLKVGRPSDIWSLGCILYQMVYGRPPFHDLGMYQKMKAIPDVAHVIEFPEYSTPSIPPSQQTGDVIECMKMCLRRVPKDRVTIPDLLAQEWLAMGDESHQTAAPAPPKLAPDETIINPHYMRQLLQYGIRLGQTGDANLDDDALMQDAERLIKELQALQRAAS
ncbi:Dual-specificity kinase, spindle pole body (SPB) duplication and spindle checkpoint function [Pleurotus ostreatus]|uniref:Dual-specificity kinase, spindle pole body (SPB) duplication and spindle checkpoint function n=1 Tax=Pleurotus ostreatus TaxID=5322 RepID=A0A8H6ZQ12_PLEOS|nr:Dual-specificity kinase, spindle pole body (SPB) duplication and spindle checkpoint function [Pleurotus ostreatus]KAF7422588.1 Dual-specificity kinase, spindle pole body (SPB) duplication and spindle checkpoint function [Pleurotus ostreatus]